MQSNLKKEVINKFSKDVFPSFLAFEKERKKILTQMIITEANVYSDDEVETRYLLTTAFMERLSNLKKSLKLKNLKCAFIDNQVVFALSKDKNMFEFVSLFKPLNQFENISFFDELFSILDLIEYFKLNEKTGL